MPNWFKRTQQHRIERSRYIFTINGDIFIPSQENKEEEKREAEELITTMLPDGNGVRTNNYNVEPYESLL